MSLWFLKPLLFVNMGWVINFLHGFDIFLFACLLQLGSCFEHPLIFVLLNCILQIRNITAAYIMKCDDDTFVRLNVILRGINNIAHKKTLYMGNLNVMHRPLRTGKWAVTYEVSSLPFNLLVFIISRFWAPDMHVQSILREGILILTCSQVQINQGAF